VNKFFLIIFATNIIKMGVDFYNCGYCNRVYADCEDNVECCYCDELLCEDCEYIVKVPLYECDGDCIEETGYKGEEEDKKEEEGNKKGKVCTCSKKAIELHTKKCDQFACCKSRGSHVICKKCLFIEDPYKVSTNEVVDFLIEKGMYESLEEVLALCREEKKAKKQKEETV